MSVGPEAMSQRNRENVDSNYDNDEFESASVSKSMGNFGNKYAHGYHGSAAAAANRRKTIQNNKNYGLSSKGDDETYSKEEFESMSVSKSVSMSVQKTILHG